MKKEKEKKRKELCTQTKVKWLFLLFFHPSPQVKACGSLSLLYNSVQTHNNQHKVHGHFHTTLITCLMDVKWVPVVGCSPVLPVQLLLQRQSANRIQPVLHLSLHNINPLVPQIYWFYNLMSFNRAQKLNCLCFWLVLVCLTQREPVWSFKEKVTEVVSEIIYMTAQDVRGIFCCNEHSTRLYSSCCM